MCITTSPARLSNTTIYAAEVERDGQVYHVLGYQNHTRTSGPNAMILPIPAAELLGPENCIDTTQFKTVLKSYSRALLRSKPVSRGRGFGNNVMKSGPPAFQVFTSGSYTVALAHSAHAIRDAVRAVPDDKRPNIPDAFLSSMATLYKDWPIAVCCFDAKLAEPEPLLWYYKPKFPHALFAPALDAHDGNLPDPGASVQRDHTVVFGSFRGRGKDVILESELRSIPDQHKWLFVPQIIGRQGIGLGTNGDFYLPVAAMYDRRMPRYLPHFPVVKPGDDMGSGYAAMFGID